MQPGRLIMERSMVDLELFEGWRCTPYLPACIQACCQLLPRLTQSHATGLCVAYIVHKTKEFRENILACMIQAVS